MGLARRLSWPARLSGGAAPLELMSQATSLALARVARSGGRHVSGGSGSQIRFLSSEGSFPHGLTGRPVLGPISLLGVVLYKWGLLGTPSLFSRQRPPSGSMILKIIVEPLVLALMAPERDIPSNCSRLQLSACARRGVMGSGPS